MDNTGYDRVKAGAQVTQPIVQLEGVAKSYGGAVALSRVDLTVHAGEFFTLLGPSGSGKTTSLRLIAGFEWPDSGRILLDGQDVASLPPFERAVNTVFQDYALFPHLTLVENVAYGLRAKKMPKTEAHEEAEKALAAVQLADFAGRKPAQLSGGQRQRVALARAMVNRPRVLLLDEPLGALDLKLRHQMQQELKRLQHETGITFIYVTHDQDEALSMSDRIAVFSQGRIEQVGTAYDLYERPASEFVADFVGSSNILGNMLLRPEKLHLLPHAHAVPEGFEKRHGLVREAVYLGAVTRYIVALEAGGTMQVMEANIVPVQGALRFAPGDAVTVAWPRAASVAIGGSSNKGEQ
ncbi:ABC transporter ATP-binding protein [Acidocella aminolytica]|jgi:putative spermidine/putrescine transport system ATP-binding protein|uniref:ABC transporter n=1 Tax=Acidocella aminolytica 101 = DSM 11237 TaxID=1120923 RepID=A0A0D6PH14_9PROT|nr:ABC transporter ATP-binding protein [Acidocella aminolytica]GAN80646.1 ABC transporter [Acidocella aminolytica 101 = DSM 11237]GBQ40230.1 nitrate/sulfonate/bicarbonate transporter ATP-binding protein [Acidocella aminolytica 101 = DSM 11237]SHE55227.1 putative spermidine/putrescine transport system ATP-binding protein [Acidocella aminolytica 101 = DSM 11237]